MGMGQTTGTEARRLSIFSFFSGIGFLDLGFECQGFDVVYANEFNTTFQDGYRHARAVMGMPPPKYGHANLDANAVLHDPAHSITTLVAAEKAAGTLVGFIGGPPCPDFSVGGKNRGRDGDHGKLSQTYVDLIQQHTPDFFLFENVKGLWRTKSHRAYYDELKRALSDHGYILADRLINAIHFGVPQDRERIILMGFHRSILAEGADSEAAVQAAMEHAYAKVERFHDWKSFPWPSRNAFGEDKAAERPSGLPAELTVEHWFHRNHVATHPNAGHAFTPKQGLPRFLSIEEGDDSRKSFKRLHRWRYSPTACYGNNEVHLHPYLPRRLSAAESLAIQSLPPEFQLPGDMPLSAMFKSIGNGVPFLAARAIAGLLRDFLRAHAR